MNIAHDVAVVVVLVVLGDGLKHDDDDSCWQIAAAGAVEQEGLLTTL
jgi:hypothetical protein